MSTALVPAGDTPPAPFDAGFEYLEGEDSAALNEDAGYILTEIAAAEWHFTNMGYRLLAARARLKKEKRYKAWCEFHFGHKFHYDTLQNYVGVVEKLPPQVARDDTIIARAKYTLTSGKPESWRIEEGVKLAEKGLLDDDSAYIVRYAPESIVRRFLAMELPKTETRLFTESFNKIPKTSPDLREAVIEWGVYDHAVMDYLREIHEKWVKTRNHERPAESWLALKDDNGLLNGFGWSKHVADPQAPAFISTHRVDRKALHELEDSTPNPNPIEYDWSENRRGCIEFKNGIAFMLIDSEMARKVQDGETVFYRMRTRRKQKT